MVTHRFKNGKALRQILVGGLIFLLTLSVYNQAMADTDPLESRNLPPGKLLYADETGSYYGALTGDYFVAPDGVGVDPQVVKLNVLAFREPEDDGTLVGLIERNIVDSSGKKVAGYSYHESEIRLVNDHIGPAIERQFPNRRWQNSITMNYFAANQYFSNGYRVSVSDQPDVEDPEQPITTLIFSRENRSSPYRPGYEARGQSGDPVSWIKRGTQDNPPSRQQLPSTIVAQRIGLRDEKVARFVTDSRDPEQVTGINNPDGMFLVGMDGSVYELKLFRERDKDGSYAIDAHRLDSGEKLIDGWWYPDTQQFWAKEWIAMPGNEQCNQMSEHRWSYSFTSSSRRIAGVTTRLFSETSSFGTKREPRTCVNARLVTRTCEIQSCNRYEKLPPRYTIVETKSTAIAVGQKRRSELDRKCQIAAAGSLFATQFCGRE